MVHPGWYKTGDLGYLDSQEYLVVYGRTKDTIKYNGQVTEPLLPLVQLSKCA
ncbi:AMP-binding protein [Candidatus Bathyarchaeota archaeon]|nr:AMP-binding protein [Candidatus Bathyarchaeota archaeon]